MAINLVYEKILGIPVAPDAVSAGTTSVLSYPTIVGGKYHSTANVNVKTYTFDFRGVDEAFVNDLMNQCEVNAKEIAEGNIDLLDIQGAGFTYKGSKCVPVSYSHGNTLSVGGSKMYSSFQITCMTDTILGGV